MEWTKSLAIFKKIIRNALPEQFFKQQIIEAKTLSKSLKLAVDIDFTKFDEKLKAEKEDKTSILPHLPHIAVKIAACYFNLGQYELAIKWLLSANIIFKNYSNFKSKQEEDFSKLAIKFLNRCSLKMLSFEIIYLMKYMPKMADENLAANLRLVEAYQSSIFIDTKQLESYFVTNNKEDPFIIEFFSATLIRIVSYCLMGDTDIALNIYQETCKYLCLLSEESAYIVYHIEYWAGRAMVSEERIEEAKAILKALLKKKKCEFGINNRIRSVLSELN